MQRYPARYDQEPGDFYLFTTATLGIAGCVVLTWGLSSIVKGHFRTWTPGADYIQWSDWKARVAGLLLCVVGVGMLALVPLAARSVPRYQFGN